MVLGVVNGHGFRRNDGFDGVVIVGQVGEGVFATRRGGGEHGRGSLGDLLGHGRGAKVGCRTEGRVDDDFATGGGHFVLRFCYSFLYLLMCIWVRRFAIIQSTNNTRLM